MNVRAVAVGVLLAGVLAGCGFGRTAVRVADDVPVPRPPVPHGPVPADDVLVRQDELLVPVADLYAEERRLAIDVACWLKTAYDLGQIRDDAEFAHRAAAEMGGDATKGARVAYLADDLISADSVDDAIGQAAVISICGV